MVRPEQKTGLLAGLYDAHTSLNKTIFISAGDVNGFSIPNSGHNYLIMQPALR
jgi:hypothetical protein